MTMTDPLGDMLTRIRNAQMRKSNKVSTPGSSLRQNVLDVLQSEGYIRGYSTVDFDNGRSEFEIELKYYDGEPVIREIERISQAGPAGLRLGQEHSARRQRARRLHPVDAEGRHVGCRGARPECRRRGALPRLLTQVETSLNGFCEMSRIGKKSVTVPKGVTANVSGQAGQGQGTEGRAVVPGERRRRDHVRRRHDLGRSRATSRSAPARPGACRARWWRT